MDRLMAGVESTLERIFSAYPAAGYRVISPLAEGADRILAARLLLNPAVRLWVPLPLPEDEYLKDFGTPASRDEFMGLLGQAERVIHLPARETREDAYLAVGKYVLEASDILIAIWDGKPAQGKGGAGEIATLARQRGLPLAWIHAGNRLPGTEQPVSIGAAQGLVTFENFPREDNKL
jgi:hypothetical protein